MADEFNPLSTLLQSSPIAKATKQVLGGISGAIKSIPPQVIENMKKLAPIPAPVKYPGVPAIHNTSDAVIQAPQKSIMYDWKKPEVQQGQEYLSMPSPDSKPIEEPTDWTKGISNMFGGVIAKDAPIRPIAEKMKNTTVAFATDPVNAMQGVYAGFNKALYEAVGNVVGLFDEATGKNIKREVGQAMERPLNEAGKQTQDVGYLAFQLIPYGYARHLAMATKFPGIVEPIINALYTGAASNDGERLQNGAIAAGLTTLFNYVTGSPAVNPQFKQQVDDAFNTLGITPETKGGISELASTKGTEAKLGIFKSAPKGYAGELAKAETAASVRSVTEAQAFLKDNPLASKIVQLGERYNILPSKVVDIIEQEIKALPAGSNIVEQGAKTREILDNPQPYIEKYAYATGGKEPFGGKMTMLKPVEGKPSVTDLGVSIPAPLPAVSKELSPLLAEAKKYSTPEEFVKKNPIGYHFTSPETKITKWSTKNSQGRIWFTDNPNAGENVGASGKGKMYTVYFDKNAKWATEEQSDKSFTDQLIAEGYDGVYHPDTTGEYGNYYEVFNPNVIKSKSQLTSIWNEAHATPESSLLQEAKKYKSAEEFVNAQTKKDYVSQVKTTTGGDIAKVGTYGEAGSAKTSARRKLAGDITNKEIEIAGRDQKIFDTNKDKTIPQLQKEIAESKKWADENNTSYPRSIQVKEEIIKIKSQLTDIWNKANKTNADDALIQEAKKYKSAEEFVKAHGTPVYHGTNYANARMIQKEGINPENAGAIQEWMKGNKYSFFTGDEKYAQSYGIQKGGGDTKSGRSFVLAIKSPKDIQIEPSTFKKGMKFPDLVSQQKISPEDIYIKGIDNKWYPIKEFNFFTGESDTFVGKTKLDELPFKTKSQLTDIWNKANKMTGEQSLINEAKKYKSATGGRPIQPGDISKAAEENVLIKPEQPIDLSYLTTKKDFKGHLKTFVSRLVDSEAIKKIGKSGEQIFNKIKLAEHTAVKEGSDAMFKLKSKLEVLSKEDTANFFDYVEGKKHTPPSAQPAVDEWRNIAKDIANKSQEYGIMIKTPGGKVPFKPKSDYVPYYVDENKLDLALRSAVKRNDLLQEMATKGKITVAKASEILDDMVNGKESMFGHLEKARMANLPDSYYKREPVYLFDYIKNAYDRLSMAKEFGGDDAGLQALIEEARKSGADYQELQALTERALGRETFDKTITNISRGARAYNNITKLSLAALTNIGDIVKPFVRTNFLSAIKGIRQSFTKPGIELAEKSGVTGKYIKDMLDVVGDTTIDSKMFKITGFNLTENKLRQIAVNAAKNYVDLLVKKLRSNPNNAFALRRLEQFGLDGKELIKNGVKESDYIDAGIQAVADAQPTSKLDIPYYWQSPVGKMATQYKTFSYKQARFFGKFIKDELKKGNPKPLIMFLLVGAAVGEGVADLKAAARGRTRIGWDDPVRRVIDNLMTVGGVGLATDFLANMQYGTLGGGFLKFVVGPTLSDIDDTISRTVSDVQNVRAGKNIVFGRPPDTGETQIKTLKKAIYSVPVLGPIVSNLLFPTRGNYQSKTIPIAEDILQLMSESDKTTKADEIRNRLKQANKKNVADEIRKKLKQ